MSASLSDSACLFCKIISGEIPATVVRDNERTLAFRDVAPQAPVHVLVVPKDHHPNAAALVEADPDLTAALVAECAQVAEQESVTDYRIVLNTGPEAGQSVFHVHAHVLGGRAMAWPPG